MKRTDDEIATARRIERLEIQRQGLTSELRNTRAALMALTGRQQGIERQLRTVEEQINLYRQGQLVLGDQAV